MNFEPVKLVFFGSWCCSLLVGGVARRRWLLYILALFAAGSSLFLQSQQLKVLSWFSELWIAYLITGTIGKRSAQGLSQKYFMVQILGALLAVAGVALAPVEPSLIFVLIGCLLVIPTFVHTLLFIRFYESVPRKDYLVAVVLPALVGLDLLLSVKPEIKSGYPFLFQAVLIGIGSVGMVLNALFGLTRTKTKSFLVYFSQAWLNLMLLVVAAEDANVSLALASVSVFLMNGSLVYLEAKQHPKWISTITISFLMAFPFFVEFNSLIYSMRVLSSYSVWIFGLFGVCLLLQAGGMMRSLSHSNAGVSRSPWRLIFYCIVSLISAVAIHSLGLKDVMG